MTSTQQPSRTPAPQPVPEPAPTARRSRRAWIVALAGLLVAGVVAWLAFGVFGVQYLVLDDRVEEAAPVFASGAGAGADAAAVPPAATAPPSSAPPVTAPPTSAAPATSAPRTTAPPTSAPPTTAPPTTVPPTSAAPAVSTVAEGSFVDRSHPTSGAVSVLTDGSDQRFLRFEDLRTDNGPDLNVYLVPASADAPAGDFDDDFVDLGTLKGNIGSQNYEIPSDVDLDRYSTVVIWCVRFAVAFGAADLT